MRLIHIIHVIMATMLSLAVTSHAEEGGTCKEEYVTCAETSIYKIGSVSAACVKASNEAQDRCAATTLARTGTVPSDCFALDAGTRCAVTSVQKFGNVLPECKEIRNLRQDRCAAASIRRMGQVFADCLKL
ncbi:MAG: hypothetical protein HC902_06085 [Calothrix sp. SM1_5_4]|nr:hypothetical protein [Calothrix sp. SM1_5_4]